MKLFQLTVGFLVIATSKTYENGAPTKSCKYMIPGHVQYLSQHPKLISRQPEELSRYIINATWSSVGGRHYVRLSITGEKLRGFLIQARLTEDGSALGSFRMLPNASKYQDCTNFKLDEIHQFHPWDLSLPNTLEHLKKGRNYSCTRKHQNKPQGVGVWFNPQASITHRDATLKDNLSVLWEPPSDEKGNVTFYATIAQSKEVYWVKLPSKAINLSEKKIQQLTTESLVSLYTSTKPNQASSVSVSMSWSVVFLLLTFLLEHYE